MFGLLVVSGHSCKVQLKNICSESDPMATSFADALSPLARTIPRAARNIEILRVSAQLDGEDLAASSNAARAAVLKWASNRAGAVLPKEAWDNALI